MTRHVAALVVLTLVAAGALLGYFGGGSLASTHRDVKLAARVWEEEAKGLKERTLGSEAFREKHSEAVFPALFRRARAIQQEFRVGGLVFGLWCGLVVAVKALLLSQPDRRTTYDVDSASCVSCGRCFLYCPRERLRLKELGPAETS